MSDCEKHLTGQFYYISCCWIRKVRFKYIILSMIKILSRKCEIMLDLNANFDILWTQTNINEIKTDKSRVAGECRQ